MAQGPKWFQKLPKKTQNGIEQALHFLLAVVWGLFLIDRPLVWWREAKAQWPWKRPEDTAQDWMWFSIGGTVGDVIRTILFYWWLTSVC